MKQSERGSSVSTWEDSLNGPTTKCLMVQEQSVLFYYHNNNSSILLQIIQMEKA